MPAFTADIIAGYQRRLVNLRKGDHGVERFDTDNGRVRAAIYARVSTEGQTEDDRAGLPEQIRLSAEYAERQGWQVAAVYWDAFSGAKNRRAFQQLIGDVERGRFDQIVARRLNRLGRSLVTLGRIKEAADRAKVGLQFYAETLPPSIISVMAGIADWERHNIAETTREGRRWKARLGKVGVAAPPFGYRTGPDGRIEKNGKEFDYLTELVRRVLAGERPRAIAADWNVRRVPPRRPLVRGWEAAHLVKFLRNPILKGEWSCLGAVVPAPAVVTPEQFDEIRAIIRRRQMHSGRPAINPAPLTGLLFCSVCGGAMTTNRRRWQYGRYRRKDGTEARYRFESKNPAAVYVCYGMRVHGLKCRTPKYLPDARIFPAVFDAVFDVTERPEKYLAELVEPQEAGASTPVVQPQDELRRCDEDLEAVKRREMNVIDKEDSGFLSKDAATDLLARYQAQRAGILERRALIERQIEERRRLEAVRAAVRGRARIVVGDWEQDDKVSLVKRHVVQIDVDAGNHLSITVAIGGQETTVDVAGEHFITMLASRRPQRSFAP